MSQQSLSRSGAGHLHQRRLQVEALEDRRLLALVTVNTELDLVNSGDEFTSLREAIAETNVTAGPDDIVFDFGHEGPATILLELGELETTEALTITGDGPDLLTIDAQEQSRILNITASTGDFSFAGMTLTRGRTTEDGHLGSGAAIRSLTTGSLMIQNSEISSNSTTGEWVFGGGVSAGGNMTVTGSTISGNSTGGEDRSGGGGGGIFARNAEVTLADSTVSDNSAPDYEGGGIKIANGSLTVTGSTVSDNSAGAGGGIVCDQDVTITDSTISGNSSGSNAGGGITAGGITMLNSTVSGNSGGLGTGGIFVRGSTVSITDSTISDNSGGRDGSGGIGIRGGEGIAVTITRSMITGNSGGDIESAGGIGIFPFDYATVTITDSTISGNSALSRGGGIHIYPYGFFDVATEVTLVNSTVSGNSAGSGGGMQLFVVDLTLLNSTISGNTGGVGGGIHVRALDLGNLLGNLTVTSSTIADNSADVAGGGIWNDNAPVTFKNAILAGNTDDGSGPDILAGTGTLSAEHSLIGDHTGTSLAEAPVGSPDGNGNLIGGPVNGLIDPILGLLADNGGPTPTQALLTGSPAIDAGDPTAMAGVGDTPEFDQRGAPFGRVEDGDDDGTARIDMGAFEGVIVVEPVLVGDMNGDSQVNFGDLDPFALGLTDIAAYEAAFPDLASTRIERGDINVDSSFNFGDLTPFVTLLTGGQATASISLDDAEAVPFAGDMRTVPGNPSRPVSQPGLRQRASEKGSSGVVDTAGLHDLALVAWLSSSPGDDADGETEFVQPIGETEATTELAAAVMEPVFQGIGA